MPPALGGIPTEETQVTDLTLEARDPREVVLEVMEEKGGGEDIAEGEMSVRVDGSEAENA